MVRKPIGTKTVRSTAKTKTASPSAAKIGAKSGSGAGKATKSKGSAGPVDSAQIAEVAKHLAAMHKSLKATAKTPDQRADVGVVGLAQQHAAQGDPATVGKLLQRLSNWARDHRILNLIEEHVAHAVSQAIMRG
jgi:hypothetical protein